MPTAGEVPRGQVWLQVSNPLPLSLSRQQRHGLVGHFFPSTLTSNTQAQDRRLSQAKQARDASSTRACLMSALGEHNTQEHTTDTPVRLCATHLPCPAGTRSTVMVRVHTTAVRATTTPPMADTPATQVGIFCVYAAGTTSQRRWVSQCVVELTQVLSRLGQKIAGLSGVHCSI